MKSICLILVFICTSTLFACSAQTTHNSNMNTISFIPEIKQDNTKLFTYTVIDPSEEQRNSMPAYWKKEVNRGTKSLDETRKRRNPEIVIERRKTFILSQLGNKLAEAGFCQNGHTIINSHFELARSSVKGKCNDSATQADRVKFSSAISTTTTELDSLNEGLLDTAK